MYLSIKSRIVSHRAAKVVSESSGERCCRNTYNKKHNYCQQVVPELLLIA